MTSLTIDELLETDAREFGPSPCNAHAYDLVHVASESLVTASNDVCHAASSARGESHRTPRGPSAERAPTHRFGQAP
jgi:hypothetical protein